MAPAPDRGTRSSSPPVPSTKCTACSGPSNPQIRRVAPEGNSPARPNAFLAGSSFGRPLETCAGSLPVDLDILLGPALADRDHDPDAHQDGDADRDPGRLNVLQKAQLPERGEATGDQNAEPAEIHSCTVND